MKNIKITGRDILELDGLDHTGALKELGVEFKAGTHWSQYADLSFEVDLDFILRHGLLDEKISREHYKNSQEYKRYYDEGVEAFNNGKEEEPPYDTGTTADPDYWTNSIYHKRYPWYEGYRVARAQFVEEKYHVNLLHEEIKVLIKGHGLELKYEDEYGYPYCKTPEGYHVDLV